MGKRKRTRTRRDENVIISKHICIKDDDDFSEFIQSPRKTKAAKLSQEVFKPNNKIPALPNEIIDRIVFFMLGGDKTGGLRINMKKRRRQLARNTRAKETYSTQAPALSYTWVLFVSRAFFEAGLRAFYGTNTLFFSQDAIWEFIRDTTKDRRKFIRSVGYELGWRRCVRSRAFMSDTKKSIVAKITKEYHDDFEKLAQAFPKINTFRIALPFSYPIALSFSDAVSDLPAEFPKQGEFQWQPTANSAKSLAVHWEHGWSGHITASED